MNSSIEGRILDGRYRVGPVLGSGGMAVVHEGDDLKLQRPIALKLLRGDISGISDVRARFAAEARVAAGLVHPNVVSVFDFGETGDQPYLVMERLAGFTLGDELRAGPMPCDAVRRLGLEVLAGLDAAHSMGLVHRDIKPANVLQAADGHWKLADFGIAKSIDPSEEHTGHGVVLGTPAYIAPERLSGRPATPSSDCYSVGVLLYRALSGRHPYEGDDALAVIHLAATTDPPTLRELGADVEPTIARVIERAMEKDPNRRFASAGAMRAALAAGATPDRHADDTARLDAVQPTLATTVTRAQPVTPASDRAVGRNRPSRRLAAVLGVLTLLLVLMAVGIGWGSGRTADDPSQNPASSVPTTAAPDSEASDSIGTGRDLEPAGRVPRVLRRAIDDLDAAVRP